MAEDTSPAEEVEAFLIRFGNADRKELERANSAVRSDESAWEAAGGRVAEIVASMGLDEQKAQLAGASNNRAPTRRSGTRTAAYARMLYGAYLENLPNRDRYPHAADTSSTPCAV